MLGLLFLLLPTFPNFFSQFPRFFSLFFLPKNHFRHVWGLAWYLLSTVITSFPGHGGCGLGGGKKTKRRTLGLRRSWRWCSRSHQLGTIGTRYHVTSCSTKTFNSAIKEVVLVSCSCGHCFRLSCVFAHFFARHGKGSNSNFRFGCGGCCCCCCFASYNLWMIVVFRQITGFPSQIKKSTRREKSWDSFDFMEIFCTSSMMSPSK